MSRRGPGGKAAFLMFDEETEELARRARARRGVPGGRAPAPAGLEDRHDRSSATRRACRACRTRWADADDYAGADAARPRRAVSATTSSCRRRTATPGRRRSSSPTKADWKAQRAEDRRPRHQGDAADRPARVRDRGRHHATRHAGRSADGRAHRVPRAHAVRRRLVRQRRLPRRADRTTARARPGTDVRDGRAAAQEGYRGYFELDFLADADSGEMYLGELNPRVTGASVITNVTAVAYGDMPLFLFHLLEFMDVDYEIDVDELNERWAAAGEHRRLDAVHPEADRRPRGADRRRRRRPASGGWMPDRAISYARRDTDWHTVADEGEAFYLRIAEPRSVPVPGSGPGDHGHARPVPGRRARADGPRASAGSTACRPSSRACRSTRARRRRFDPSRSASRCSEPGPMPSG